MLVSELHDALRDGYVLTLAIARGPNVVLTAFALWGAWEPCFALDG